MTDRDDGPISDDQILDTYDSVDGDNELQDAVLFARALLRREGERLINQHAKPMLTMDELHHLTKVHIIDAKHVRRMFGIKEP
jgi:hypothetical protein